jgi:hypothetical protein
MSSQAAPQPLPHADSPAPLSEISRVAGVFASPKSAFADIVARPRFYVPLILVCIASLCLIFLYSQRVGFDRMIQQSLDQNPRTQTMTPEQRDQALKMGLAIGRPMAFVTAIVAPPVSALVIAAVLMFIANSMLGSQLRFSQMAAITSYSMLTGIVSVALSIVVMFVRSPDEFDLRNPLAFNVGAFLNADTTPKWLLSFATSIDLFSFWTMALIAIGIVVASRKVAFTKALVAVMIPWAVYVVLKSAGAGIFG